jgi:hypothetical protein
VFLVEIRIAIQGVDSHYEMHIILLEKDFKSLRRARHL